MRIDSDGVDDWGNPVTTETSHAVRAIVTGTREAFGVTPGLDGGERVGVLNALDTGAVPAIGDKLTLAGETLTLLEIEPVRPDPQQVAILYRWKGKL